jgi:hypothetical protein
MNKDAQQWPMDHQLGNNTRNQKEATVTQYALNIKSIKEQYH